MIGSVVVLYNPTEKEILNVNSYLNKVDYAVIFDNSKENHSELVSNNLNNSKNYIYLTQNSNLGLCKALNLGIQVLKKHGCKLAFVTDADSRIDESIFEVYNKAINDFRNENNIALYSPVHIYDRSKNKPFDGYRSIKFSMTSGWLLDIDIFLKQNGFFEELFVDGLDFDYCFKSINNGYKIIECGQAIVYHHPAETQVFLGLKYGIASPFRYYMQFRSLSWLILRYRSFSMIKFFLWKFFKIIFLFKNKTKFLSSFFKGTFDGSKLFFEYRNKNSKMSEIDL